MLDSNEYILGISGDKKSCVQLIDRLDHLRVLIPVMVVREVQRNLENMYGLGYAFFRLINHREHITIVWLPPPETLIMAYVNRGLSEEDATIAAVAEQAGVEYLISENRHFLKHSEPLPFQVINAETALQLLS
jgi:predicted nucleic acid-binding protein